MRWWRGSNRATYPRTRPRPYRQGRGRAGRARRSRLYRRAICSRRRRHFGGLKGGHRPFNRVDEAITFATLPAFKLVVDGEMIATGRRFRRDQRRLAEGRAPAAGKPFIYVAPYTIKKVGVVSTLLLGSSPIKVVEKTLRVTRIA